MHEIYLNILVAARSDYQILINFGRNNGRDLYQLVERF